MRAPIIMSALALAGMLAAQGEAPKEGAKAPAATNPAVEQPAAEKKAGPRWIAIKDATLHTVSHGVIQGGTLLIKDKLIHAVGTDVTIPEGAEIIDARGKHVAPGFVAIAAKGALGLRNSTNKEKAEHRFDPFADFMQLALANGVTTAHESGGMADSMFGGLFGSAGSAFIGSHTGQLGGVVGKLTAGTIEGFTLREPAAFYMNAPGQQGGSARLEQRDVFEKAKKHRAAVKAWLKDLAAGKKDLTEPKTDENVSALADAMNGEVPVFYYADNRREMEFGLELAQEFGVPVILHTAQEAWAMVADVSRSAAGVILLPRGKGGSATRPYTDPNIDAPHGWRIESAAIMQKTGVPWSTMTLNTGITTSLFGGRDLLGLNLEAAFAVRGGVSNEEALRSITLTPAEMLRVADRVGSLDKGKDADILILDREPLDYRTFVEKAFVNGRVAYDESVTPLYAHIQTDRRQPPKNWKPWGIWGELPEQKNPAPLPDGSPAPAPVK